MDFSQIIGYAFAIGFFLVGALFILGFYLEANKKPDPPVIPDKIIFTFRDETAKPHTQGSGQTPDPGQAAPLQSAAEAPQVPYGIRYPKAWEAASSDVQDLSREERL